jgi:hypothetical protein
MTPVSWRLEKFKKNQLEIILRRVSTRDCGESRFGVATGVAA